MLTIKEIKKELNLHITTNHSGKMDGMISLSTSPNVNKQCNKNCLIDGAICQKCFSKKQTKMYTNQDLALIKNHEILTSAILSDEDLPIINALYFRFEAFGDLDNEIQCINYFNIAKNNPFVNFTIWTKNPHIMKKAIDQGHEKPQNLTVIYSSLFINKSVKIETLQKKYPFIDKVFTVYDQETIKNENIEINCGARSCMKCLKCYRKNDIVYINEKLK